MPKDIVYTLSLTVTRSTEPTSSYEDVTEAQLIGEMTCTEAKRQLERDVLTHLRKLDGDCDIEVMSVEVVG